MPHRSEGGPLEGGAPPADLRERLRSLGYLQNPLEKFLVGRVDADASILRTNLTVGARVGFLAGLFLGLLVSLALLLVVPDLSRRPGDAVSVVLLFSLLFSVSVGLFGILSGILTSLVYRLTRRVWPATRLTAFKVGSLAGAVVFIYLSLLWSQYDQRYGVGASVVAFLLILAVSVFVGRTIAVGAFVVLCRLSGALEPEKRLAPPSTARALVILSLAAVVAFFGGLAWSRTRAPDPPPAAPPVVRRVPVDTRIVLVTIDGLSLRDAREMMERGELPETRKLVESGPALRLESVNASIPPSMWTTVATGRPPDEHGIRSFTYPRVVGTKEPLAVPPGTAGLGEMLNVVMPWLKLARETPVSGRFNPERSLWDIFSLKDVRVGVVNWWFTWPATRVSGILASDRTYWKLVESGFDASGAPRPDLPVGLETYPPGLLAECLEAARYPESIDARAIAPCGADGEEAAARREDALRLAAGVDGFAAEFASAQLSAALLRESPYGFFAVSLYGLDALKNALSDARPKQESPAERALEDAIAAAYARHVDRLVGRIRESVGGDRDVVFVLATSPGKSGEEGDEARDGLLALSGRGLASPPPEPFSAAARAVDVAPTFLYLMGFPISREMPGRILEEALSPSAFLSRAPDVIGSYGRRAVAEVAALARDLGDDEELLRLRRLGYVR